MCTLTCDWHVVLPFVVSQASALHNSIVCILCPRLLGLLFCFALVVVGLCLEACNALLRLCTIRACLCALLHTVKSTCVWVNLVTGHACLLVGMAHCDTRALATLVVCLKQHPEVCWPIFGGSLLHSTLPQKALLVVLHLPQPAPALALPSATSLGRCAAALIMVGPGPAASCMKPCGRAGSCCAVRMAGCMHFVF